MCPYTMIEDCLQIVCHNHAKRPAHSHFFVVTTDFQKPAHSETVRHWAVDTLKLAGVTQNPHSIRSAHASIAVVHNESIDSIMERCGWRRSSTFNKHYLRPVASGEKPTSPQGVTIDTTTFFCPPELLKPGTHVIPPPPEYILQSDIFPCGTSDPIDFELNPASTLEISMEWYKCKTATTEEKAVLDKQLSNQEMQANIKVTEALLAPSQEEKEQIEQTLQETSKKSLYLVITSQQNPEQKTTVVLSKPQNFTPSAMAAQQITATTITKPPKIKPKIELKMSPQYLTLRSRTLLQKSFSKKVYPKKRAL